MKQYQVHILFFEETSTNSTFKILDLSKHDPYQDTLIWDLKTALSKTWVQVLKSKYGSDLKKKKSKSILYLHKHSKTPFYISTLASDTL